MNFGHSIRFVLCGSLLSVLLNAQHLPPGTYHPNRERTYDIIHYKASLQIDWSKKSVSGEASVKLKPLSDLSSFSLDAIRMNVTSVRELPKGTSVKFTSADSTLVILLGRTVHPTDTISVAIQYSATPTAGMYFIDPPQGSKRLPEISTYGEGGLHANWLPIYNEPNDKFSTELSVTVASPYSVISNGRLLEKKVNGDGTQSFHWLQERPHSNYLIALFVGDYDTVQLRPAFGTIPLTCWVPRDQKEEGRFVFQRTTEMVEFFSQRFNYRYPWDKYDQVASYDYAIGAMENTGITGHNDRILRKPSDLEEFNPDPGNYTENWSAEAIVSHELSHHWFGDNLTCRSLGSIWLNESFATYCMMLWDEHRLGKEFLQFSTWMALQSYLTFVENSHLIRPMEYRQYDSRNEIYNEQTTYLKGGILLNTLRWILGDDDFFRGLSYYLHKHEFTNVESTDLKIALEEATGKNLDWFFNQWVYSGGHPKLEVAYQYLADRKKLELTAHQTQPIVEGQGFFSLPVEIRIDTKSKSIRETIWVERETDHFVFDVSEKPLMVSFDGRGALVCDLHFEKGDDELVYQLQNDEAPGKLWALHQLVERFPSMPQTLAAVRSLLNGDAAWWLKSEGALQLQRVHSEEAGQLLVEQLKSSDYHVRKAAAIALRSHFTKPSADALREVIRSDGNTSVVSAAVVSYAKIDHSLTPEFFREILTRPSWYDELRVAALTAMQQSKQDKFVPLINDNVSLKYNMAVRDQALNAWVACSPTDPQLVEALISSAKREVSRVRETAIGLLGKLKVERAVPLLKEIGKKDGDGDIRKAASDALEEIERVPAGK